MSIQPKLERLYSI